MNGKKLIERPAFYAYRYPDGVRFNSGQDVNGNGPIESIPLYTADQIAALEAQPRLPKGYSLVRKGEDLIECRKQGVECFTSYKASLTFEFLSAFLPQPAQPESVKPEGGRVTESIWSHKHLVVALAEVQHVEKYKYGLTVVTSKTRWDCEHDVWANPINIPEDQAECFLSAWCNYRHELEFHTLADLRPDATTRKLDEARK